MKLNKILSIFTATVLFSSLALFVSCDKTEENTGETSALIGKFEASANLEKILTNDEDYLSKENAQNYLYTSNVYPLNTVVAEGVQYSYQQTLRLKLDFSYQYDYDVRVRKITQNGNTELARMEVSMIGTFDFDPIGDSVTDYNVTLSNPTSGKESFYGAHVVGENNVYGWKLSSNPVYTLDLSRVADKKNYTFDKYVKGRTVQVIKAEERVITDDVFFADILCDLAPYYSYEGNDPTGELDVPPENPNVPDTPTTAEQAYQAVLPFKAIGEGVEGAVCVDETGVKTLFRVPLGSKNLSVNGTKITDYKTVGEYEIFTAVTNFKNLPQTLTVTGDKTGSFDVENYLRSFITAVTTISGNSEELPALANRAVAVSLLNMAKERGADIVLSPDESNLVFVSEGFDNNYYHKDWGQRDNFTVSQGNGTDGIVWNAPQENTLQVSDSGAGLRITFTTPANAYETLTATATQKGKTQNVTVQKTGTEGGNDTYAVLTNDYTPVTFEDAVVIQVYNGTTAVGGTLSYSINRAIAKADLSADENVKSTSKAVYSLGMATAWLSCQDDVAVMRSPAANNGTGYYDLTLWNYRYHYNFTGTPVAKNDEGSAFYINDTIISNAQTSVTESNFTAIKTGETYEVTLNGGTIDGIYPANEKAVEKITIKVTADTVIKEALKPMWGVDNNKPSASVYADCPVEIISTNGAKLTVNGNIITGNLTIDGTRVTLNGKGNVTAVQCVTLDILNNGELNAHYLNKTTSNQSGIVVKGDVTLTDGTLRSTGYQNGVWLEGNDVTAFTVTGNAKLHITADGYGITGSAPTIGGNAANRAFSFDGGESYIEAGSGLRFADVSVGDATFTVIANNGYTIEGEDDSRPVTFKTTSGDYQKGKITLVNNTYNAWSDVHYTLKVQTMDLYGGNVYIFGMCKDGIIHTYRDSKITMRNCNASIVSGHNLAVYARAFLFGNNNGDEVVTIENSAYVVVKDCDVIADVREKNEAAENYATIVNKGLLIIDGYKCSIKTGEQNWSWGSLLVVKNEGGDIRETNRVG